MVMIAGVFCRREAAVNCCGARDPIWIEYVSTPPGTAGIENEKSQVLALAPRAITPLSRAPMAIFLPSGSSTVTRVSRATSLAEPGATHAAPVAR